MARLGNQVFTYTWRIENFSMCPQQFKQRVESPEFVVDFLEHTKWKLRIYPRGDIDQNYSRVSLVRAVGCEYTHEIDILWKLAALSTFDGKNMESGMQNDTFESGKDLGFSKFWARDKIFKSESGLLPNDTLTLRCQMSRGVKEEKTKGVIEELKTDDWNCSATIKKYECSARTRITVSTTSFVWPIKRIDELSGDVKLLSSVPPVIESDLSLDFSLYLKKDVEEEKSTRVEIRWKNASKEGFFVRCHTRTVGAPRSAQFEGLAEHYFKAGGQDIWIFPTFFKMKDLAGSYLKFTDGALYLQFDLSFSKENDLRHVENISETCHLDCVSERERPCISRSNLQNLNIDGEFADAVLRVEEREFKVHKLILISESDVFRRMFESGMKEEQNGVVDIEDFDADTVEKLLKYMYTHELEKLVPEDCIKLYSAADKYNMKDLKCRLPLYLSASLSVNSVCETLILADLHHDEDLLESVFEYVSRNNTEIFHSPNWKDFLESHTELAARTMFRYLVRK